MKNEISFKQAGISITFETFCMVKKIKKLFYWAMPIVNPKQPK